MLYGVLSTLCHHYILLLFCMDDLHCFSRVTHPLQMHKTIYFHSQASSPVQPNICVNCTSTVAFSSFALSIQWIVYGFSYSCSHLFSYTICVIHCIDVHRSSCTMAQSEKHKNVYVHRSSCVTMLIHGMNIVCNSISNVQCSAHSNAQNNAKKIYNKLMKLMPEWNVYGCETPNFDAHC